MPGYVATVVNADRVEVVDERSGYTRINFVASEARISLDLPPDMAADLLAQLREHVQEVAR